jgi:hypothetical protein
VILTTPIGLKSLDFCVQKSFNMRLESIEDLLDIRLMFEKINPTEMRIVINKANIVFKTTRGCNSRPPNIRMN